MSYIRIASLTVTPSSLVATNGYTTAFNGILRRMQYQTTNGTPSSGIKCTIGSEGSSKNQLMRFEKLTSGPVEIYPMANVNSAGSTVLTSSGLNAPIPISEGRLKVCLSAASSANSTGGIRFAFWYE